MIRSLIGQLLHQYPSCPSSIGDYVSLDRADGGSIPDLCKLFSLLAKQPPPNMTIFCLIDGIHLYERDEYWKELDQILCSLIELAEDEEQGLSATMKILLTSPRVTRYVRRVFDAGTSLLTMATIPAIGQGPSTLRLNREFGIQL